MSEYKRLTLHNLTSAYDYAKSNLSQEEIAKIYDRLAELEDKIESVLWVELPCKVGDVFFGFPNKTDALNQYFRYTVKGIEYREDGVYLRTSYDMCFKYRDEAFMTEAEARLKELKGESV